jgi:Tfp pilus assembly protein PilF
MKVAAQGLEHPDTIVSLSNLAQLLARAGQYDEAERLFTQLANLHEKRAGGQPADPAAISVLNNLACIYTKQVTAATSLLQNSLQIKPQQPDVIAKRNTKTTRNRVKPPFVGVCRGGNRVQVIQNNTQQARFCNGFCKRLVLK